MKKIIGLGNALTDVLLQVQEEDVKALNLPKGSMNLINFDTALAVQRRFEQVRKTMVAGGSASNTINAIALLGGKAAFIGKLGNDEVGEFYRNDMLKNGVKPFLLPSSLMSGCCTVLITPDGERTMCTYLGASADLGPDDIRKEAFFGYDIFHIEGYMVQNHALIEKAITLAKDAGLTVSIDLASYNVVNENRDFLHKLVSDYVDIVFANEDESYAYTHLPPQQAVAAIARQCKIAVVKVGKRGSYVQCGTEVCQIGAIASRCLDSTGAGDFYAAGFLHGLADGFDIRRCAEIGTLAAGRVVEVVGTQLSEETWNEIRRICALYRGFMMHADN
ncbi:MAG: adenosine kinase [Paludibacter sp.]|nr:adenosine kinase [Bacteroidales bacterium]MCM1068546.1 adenosine kinase [Prevotella sp.]MCM1353210.1 adenosine kinase [Bacteroides sp.]MCM1442382.1 adenosine kinase [Muribaculum sp.]MCM1481201.1 adenosine kinase [Paludibacter sp.]